MMNLAWTMPVLKPGSFVHFVIILLSACLISFKFYGYFLQIILTVQILSKSFAERLTIAAH